MRWSLKVRQNRLLGMLKVYGFTFGRESRSTDGLIFTRASHIKELFEAIIVDSQGKRGEAVYASVGVAITETVMHKLLGDVRFLEELGEDSQRGWTIIEDDGKARLWEARVAEIGPIRAKEWANARGPQLLQETAQARAAANKYLSLLEPTSLEQKFVALRKASSTPAAEEAERLSRCPIFDDESEATRLAYRSACYVIMCRSNEVEGKSYFGRDPMNDTSLLERIEIVADKLL